MDKRLKAVLAVAAMDHAVASRKPAGTTVLCDRGPQFKYRKFVLALTSYGPNRSMGRVRACGDNVAMESFFSLLQKNVLNRKRWEARAELRLAITTWFERSYYRKRRQRALGRLTPIEFETKKTRPQPRKKISTPAVNETFSSPLRPSDSAKPFEITASPAKRRVP